MMSETMCLELKLLALRYILNFKISFSKIEGIHVMESMVKSEQDH